MKKVVRLFVGVVDFLFFFFGCTYEKQAKKLKLNELDPLITGPENETTSHQFYRANKVGKDS